MATKNPMPILIPLFVSYGQYGVGTSYIESMSGLQVKVVGKSPQQESSLLFEVSPSPLPP